MEWRAAPSDQSLDQSLSDVSPSHTSRGQPNHIRARVTTEVLQVFKSDAKRRKCVVTISRINRANLERNNFIRRRRVCDAAMAVKAALLCAAFFLQYASAELRGRCPAESVSCPARATPCGSDDECGEQICCSTSCGRACVDPLYTGQFSNKQNLPYPF
ncbi:uncharacterized protein LOC135080813 [Ostrinia nubilalis]|uniref:uncharacterized protein LOC135080813 n=1 Tax=Ostrinia nubilalis TaxID=29057 RepID=UPI0030822E27